MARAALSLGLCVGTLLAVYPAPSALAQPPDRLEHFQFLPRRSILHVMGGFPGFDIRANIHGTFDFITGFRRDDPDPLRIGPPGLHPYAKFANVDAVGINPTDFGPYEFDLDQALNLSNLEGKLVVPTPHFDLYRFQGKEPFGSSIDLHVLRIGRWLLMGGETMAPVGGADFIEYEVRAIARRSRFADFNADAIVDRLDFDAWQAEYGRDGLSGADFLEAQRQLGESMPSFDQFDELVAAASAASAVPEPAAISLIIGAGAAWPLRRRR